MKKITPIILTFILSALIMLSGCSSRIDYETVSKDTYVYDGELCQSYRVYVNDSNLSDSQLNDLLDWVVYDNDNDGDYPYHTVWVYFDKSAADGSDAADITIEETSILGDPVITRN